MTLWQPALLTELLDRPPCRMIAESSHVSPVGLTRADMAGNSPVSSRWL